MIFYRILFVISFVVVGILVFKGLNQEYHHSYSLKEVPKHNVKDLMQSGKINYSLAEAEIIFPEVKNLDLDSNKVVVEIRGVHKKISDLTNQEKYEYSVQLDDPEEAIKLFPGMSHGDVQSDKYIYMFQNEIIDKRPSENEWMKETHMYSKYVGRNVSSIAPPKYYSGTWKHWYSKIKTSYEFEIENGTIQTVTIHYDFGKLKIYHMGQDRRNEWFDHSGELLKMTSDEYVDDTGKFISSVIYDKEKGVDKR